MVLGSWISRQCRGLWLLDTYKMRMPWKKTVSQKHVVEESGSLSMLVRLRKGLTVFRCGSDVGDRETAPRA